MTRRCKGFTLIELLVVVSIIALLVSILLPALGRAREQARQVKCLSNMRGMGIAFHTYAAENDNWIPPRHATSGANASNAKRLWQYELAPYLGLRQGPPDAYTITADQGDINTWAVPPDGWANAKGAVEIFMCPSRRPKPGDGVYHFYAINWFGLTYYGQKGMGSPSAKTQKLDRVSPETILVGEYTHWNFWHPQCCDYQYDDYINNAGNFNQGKPIAPIHGKGYNFLFAGSHASFMTNSEPRMWMDYD